MTPSQQTQIDWTPLVGKRRMRAVMREQDAWRHESNRWNSDPVTFMRRNGLRLLGRTFAGVYTETWMASDERSDLFKISEDQAWR